LVADGIRWSEQITNFLLNAYQELELKGVKKNVYVRLAEVINDDPRITVRVLPDQVKSKINELKKTYRQIKDRNEKKTGRNLTKWKYFTVSKK